MTPYSGSRAIHRDGLHAARMATAAVQGLHLVPLCMPLPQENCLVHGGAQQQARQAVFRKENTGNNLVQKFYSVLKLKN